MTLRLANISFDAKDPFAQASWWNQLLEDFTQGAQDGPGDQECGLEAENGQAVLFIRVPQGKTGKNRIHLCLTAVEGGRDAEVERLLVLGAKVHDDRRTPDGRGWVVLLDPEGNEFCVVRSQLERAATAD